MCRKIFYLFLFFMIFAFISCKDKSGNPEDSEGIDPDTEAPQELEDGQITNVIKSFGSPIEMAALVKSVGASFSLGYLCPTEKFDDFTTDFQKSLGLGLLSADLGYLNIYERTASIVQYITVIKRLADDLKIGQFFDFQTLKRLATQNENLDRLMFESINSFNQMDTHLREHNRSNLSTLIIAGVWIEGLYLGTQVYKNSKNEEIGERIGEQKIILKELLLILNIYKSDKQFQKLIQYFETISVEYEGVQISYTIGEPKAVEKDGKITIEQVETSIVDISDEQLQKIIKITDEVRNKIINQI